MMLHFYSPSLSYTYLGNASTFDAVVAQRGAAERTAGQAVADRKAGLQSAAE